MLGLSFGGPCRGFILTRQHRTALEPDELGQRAQGGADLGAGVDRAVPMSPSGWIRSLSRSGSPRHRTSQLQSHVGKWEWLAGRIRDVVGLDGLYARQKG